MKIIDRCILAAACVSVFLLAFSIYSADSRVSLLEKKVDSLTAICQSQLDTAGIQGDSIEELREYVDFQFERNLGLRSLDDPTLSPLERGDGEHYADLIKKRTAVLELIEKLRREAESKREEEPGADAKKLAPIIPSADPPPAPPNVIQFDIK